MNSVHSGSVAEDLSLYRLPFDYISPGIHSTMIKLKIWEFRQFYQDDCIPDSILDSFKNE